MAEETYDGAIGIDLGKMASLLQRVLRELALLRLGSN